LADEGLEIAYGAEELGPVLPRARLFPGRALRLNAARYELGATPGLAPSADPALLLERHLAGLCSPWAGASRRFVEGYFAYLRRALADAAEDAAARLAPFAGLYAVEDWLFSAPALLPRAHLPVGGDGRVRADFAIWRGDELVAVLDRDAGLTPRRVRERDAQLAEAGIAVLPFSGAEIGPELFNRLLGPRHVRFWEGEHVPSGPFRPANLDLVPAPAARA
jgi:hypothetical protein